MVDDKWADLMSQLMRIAKDLFQSVENFEKGKLIAEVQAETNVRIEIARDKYGRTNANLTILPSEEEREEEKMNMPIPENREEETVEEEIKAEEPREEESSLKEEIEVLDLDEEKQDLPNINLDESRI